MSARFVRMRANERTTDNDMNQHTRTAKKGMSFVITLWLEPTEGDQPEWRWRVTEMETGAQRYFRKLADMLAYVSERAGVSPPG